MSGTFKYLRVWAGTITACLVVFLAISLVAAALRPHHDTIRDHIKQDVEGVISAKSTGDAHTECLLLSSAVAPQSSPLQYILDPKMLVSGDPCVGLADALADKGDLNWMSYSRYWMGTAYLDAISLYFLNLSGVHTLYKVLLAASIIVSGVSGFVGLRRDLRLPLAIAALGIFAGIGIQKFGGSLGHSPAFFLPMFAFAAIIAFRFTELGRREAVIVGSLIGSITGYYDILSGAIPFTIALSIFVYYLLWKDRSQPGSGIIDLLADVLFMLVAYIVSVVFLVFLKLFFFLVVLGKPDAIQDFVNELALRVSDQGVPGNAVSVVAHVFQRLWWNSEDVYIGGRISASLAFSFGFIFWVFAIAVSANKYRRSRSVEDIMDTAVLLTASAVILGWFLVFRNHGYWHAWFMTRILCVIPTFGMVAAAMAVGRLRRRADSIRYSGSVR